MYYNQSEFNIRCEWGIKGVEILAPISDVIIIVDILSFTTCVDIALSNGAYVYPYRYKDNTVFDYAKNFDAIVADNLRESKGYNLSPSSLIKIPVNTKLVLPSPNGATLSLATGNTITIAACLRNYQAVAEKAMTMGKNIAVIPAGEKWQDGTIRPALEDLIGAGAVISCLRGNLSPESEMTLISFNSFKNNIIDKIKNCISGKELIERGFEKDVDIACELNISKAVPIFKNNIFYTKF